MERFCDIFGHPHELVIHRGWRRALRHKVANGLYGIAETEQERCRGTPDTVLRESGSPPVSYVIALANKKVRWCRSFQDGQGPRKAPSWRSNLS